MIIGFLALSFSLSFSHSPFSPLLLCSSLPVSLLLYVAIQVLNDSTNTVTVNSITRVRKGRVYKRLHHRDRLQCHHKALRWLFSEVCVCVCTFTFICYLVGLGLQYFLVIFRTNVWNKGRLCNWVPSLKALRKACLREGLKEETH